MTKKESIRVPKRRGEKARVRDRPEPELETPLNHEQARIHQWLKQVRFQKITFGGVDEADVWKKIAELNGLYEAALSAERARYDALLAERTGSAAPPHSGCANHGGDGEKNYP